MTETKPKRRWFRFSLRTLLVVVTLAAIGSWTYWIGWPWFAAYWQQARFERAVKQLKIGVTTNLEHGLLPQPKSGVDWRHTRDVKGDLVCLSHYALTNGVYFIYYRFPDDYEGDINSAPFTSVEVFRLPPVPTGYKPQRKLRLPGGEPPDEAYADDFREFVTGDRNDAFGLKYELIYSDPPRAEE